MTLLLDETTHTYTIDGEVLPSVTQILEAEGFIDYSMIPPDIREAAMARGQAVHRSIHFLHEEDLDWSSVDPDIRPYLDAYQRFRAESGFVPERVEARVFHPTYGYAGTLDLDGIYRGQPTLIDTKTGHLPRWTRLQTAAYAACLEGPRLRFGLELRGDGTYRLDGPYTDPRDLDVFLAAVTTYHARKEYRS